MKCLIIFLFFLAMVAADRTVEEALSKLLVDATPVTTFQHLREEVAGGWFKGWLQILEFRDSSCSEFNDGVMFMLNTCLPVAGVTGSQAGIIKAKRNGHTNDVHFHWYSDAHCTHALSTQHQIIPVWQCSSSSRNKIRLTNSFDFGGETGVGIGQFHSRQQCISNHNNQNFIEIGTLYPLNHCVVQGNGAGDLLYSSCQHNVHWNTYSSNDGTCTGSSSPSTFSNAERCTRIDGTYWNFGCVNH